MNSYSAGDVIAVVPAAGQGSRMGLDTPKQYLPLNGATVLACTLDRLHAVTSIKRIILVVADPAQLPDDLRSDSRLDIVIGSDSRAASVQNGLIYIQQQLNFAGLVLVHDAARPCVRADDIERLIAEVADSEHGGLLAVPVHDTLKRADTCQLVVDTVDRTHLWRAVTPQLFRADLLNQALASAQQQQLTITDESSAMEHLGYKPRLVSSAQDNIKITELADMQLAQTILEAQEIE